MGFSAERGIGDEFDRVVIALLITVLITAAFISPPGLAITFIEAQLRRKLPY